METITRTRSLSATMSELLAIDLSYVLPDGYIVADGWTEGDLDNWVGPTQLWHSVKHELVKEAHDWVQTFIPPERYGPVLAFDLLIGNTDRVMCNYGLDAQDNIILFDHEDSWGTPAAVLAALHGVVETERSYGENCTFEYYIEAANSPGFKETINSFSPLRPVPHDASRIADNYQFLINQLAFSRLIEKWRDMEMAA